LTVPPQSIRQKNARRGGRAKGKITADTVTQSVREGNSERTKADADSEIVGEWPIGRHEHLRVSVELFNGVWLVNCRKWFEAENGELRPGKQGIALGVKQLPRLVEAMGRALASARQRKLIDDPAAGPEATGS
jgi:Transcriptional Coactivator p15 (PC4)